MVEEILAVGEPLVGNAGVPIVLKVHRGMAKVPQAVLDTIIQRIVEVAQPERIILFGSAARGDMGPHSDVDLLVVKSGEFDQSRLVGDIYMHLHGVGQAVDVLVVTPEQVEQYRNTHCLIIAPALREGQEVYRACTLPS
jgi:predicted nucleotidyltransferase